MYNVHRVQGVDLKMPYTSKQLRGGRLDELIQNATNQLSSMPWQMAPWKNVMLLEYEEQHVKYQMTANSTR